MSPPLTPYSEPALMVPLTVTAYLQQGVAFDTLFGTALDGLLASTIRDRAKAARSAASGTVITGSLYDGGLREETPATVELPLARCPHAPAEQWHWLCTTAFPLTPTGGTVHGDPDVHYQHSRVREHLVNQTVTRIPASIPPASGRYRLRRIPVVTTPAHALIWRGVGHPDSIRDLLHAVPTIGRRRSSGEGTVLRWEVSQIATSEPVRHGHTHPDGTLGRPNPLGCTQVLGLPTDRTGNAGLRPPYWHPATQHHVVLPRPLQGDPHA